MHLKKNETKGIIAITAVALFVAVSLHAQFVGAEDRTASQDYAPIELSDVDIASRLKPLLARLQGIDDSPSGITASPDDTIIMFFAPHCPPCQEAYEALLGRYPIKFVPVSADPPSEAREEMAIIRGVLRAEDRKTALRYLMKDWQVVGLDTSSDEKLDASIQENYEVFGVLASKLEDQAGGLPFFVFPKKSGEVIFSKGWSTSMRPIVQQFMDGSMSDRSFN